MSTQSHLPAYRSLTLPHALPPLVFLGRSCSGSVDLWYAGHGTLARPSILYRRRRARTAAVTSPPPSRPATRSMLRNAPLVLSLASLLPGRHPLPRRLRRRSSTTKANQAPPPRAARGSLHGHTRLHRSLSLSLSPSVFLALRACPAVLPEDLALRFCSLHGLRQHRQNT